MHLVAAVSRHPRVGGGKRSRARQPEGLWDPLFFFRLVPGTTRGRGGRGPSFGLVKDLWVLPWMASLGGPPRREARPQPWTGGEAFSRRGL